MLITLKAPQPSLRSFFSFFSLSLIVAILFILTGSYGSFISILMTSVVSGGVGWLVWVLIKTFTTPCNRSLCLQNMFSAGFFSLILLGNIHHPMIEDNFSTVAHWVNIPLNLLQNPFAFILGALIGLSIYSMNKKFVH